jgi:hypothetical protein
MASASRFVILALSVLGIAVSRCIACLKSQHEGRGGREAHEEAASRWPPSVLTLEGRRPSWRRPFVSSMTFTLFVFAFETGNVAWQRDTPAAATSVPGQNQTRVATVFVDDMHLPALDTPRVRSLLRAVLDQLLKNDGLIEMTSSGRTRRTFVYDRDVWRLERELRTVMGSGSPPRGNPDPAWVAEQQRFAEQAISTATNIVSDLERNPNRPRVLIYFSGGYAHAGTSVDTPLNDLARAASRAGVVIYHLDPARWDAGDPKSSSALDRLAAATGGFTLTAVTDFARVAGTR